ncbi:MAG: right-handed parallel beta-helix repeat-containing protein [Phycisphaerae bacterium]
MGSISWSANLRRLVSVLLGAMFLLLSIGCSPRRVPPLARRVPLAGSSPKILPGRAPPKVGVSALSVRSASPPCPSPLGPLGPNNPAALVPAAMLAYNSGKGEFVIPPGVYRLPQPSRGSYAYLSFSYLRNFRIVAKGVTFLRSDPALTCISFHRCQGVTLDGPTLRCDPLPYTQGRIIAMNRKKRWLEIRICKGYQADLSNPARFNSHPTGTVYSPRTFRIKPGTVDINEGGIVGLGNREFRVTHVWCWRDPSPLAAVRVGDLIAFIGHVRNDVTISFCRNMCIRDTTVEGGSGLVFADLCGGGNRYIDDTITYPPRPRGALIPPLKASNADGLHSALTRCGPSIVGCHFDGTGDDGIAIHGWYVTLRNAVRKNWTVLPHFGVQSRIRVGDALKLYSPGGSYLGRTTVVDIKPPVARIPARPAPRFCGPPFHFYSITVAHPVGHEGFGDLVCDANLTGSGFVIRGCVIRNNRARGMNIKGDNGTILDNVIDGSSAGGIEVGPEPGWDESGCSCHVLIAGNLIRHVGYATAYAPPLWEAGAVSILGNTGASAVNFGHDGIAVVGNRFADDNGINLLVTDTRNMLVSGNIFTGSMRSPDNRGANYYFNTSSLVWLQQCKNVLLAGNRVIHPGAAMNKLVGVGPDTSNIKGSQNGLKITVP